MTRKWLILIFIFCCISGKITAHDNSLKLWYDKPAKQWVEALLVIHADAYSGLCHSITLLLNTM